MCCFNPFKLCCCCCKCGICGIMIKYLYIFFKIITFLTFSAIVFFSFALLGVWISSENDDVNSIIQKIANSPLAQSNEAKQLISYSMKLILRNEKTFKKWQELENKTITDDLFNVKNITTVHFWTTMVSALFDDSPPDFLLFVLAHSPQRVRVAFTVSGTIATFVFWIILYFICGCQLCCCIHKILKKKQKSENEKPDNEIEFQKLDEEQKSKSKNDKKSKSGKVKSKKNNR